MLIINTLFILACFSQWLHPALVTEECERVNICASYPPLTSTMALLCSQYKFLLPPAADKAVHVDLSSPTSHLSFLPLSVCALMGQASRGNFDIAIPSGRLSPPLMHSSLTSSFRFQLHILRDSCLPWTRPEQTTQLSYLLEANARK